MDETFMKKQKTRNTKAWKIARRKQRPRRAKQTSIHARPLGSQWNYQPCKAWRGSVIVGTVDKPTWWCAGMEGTRRRCVKVQTWGEPFFIDDEDGRGTLKVFIRGGGPDSYHASIPVDDAKSFIPENVESIHPESKPKDHE